MCKKPLTGLEVGGERLEVKGDVLRLQRRGRHAAGERVQGGPVGRVCPAGN